MPKGETKSNGKHVDLKYSVPLQQHQRLSKRNEGKKSDSIFDYMRKEIRIYSLKKDNILFDT